MILALDLGTDTGFCLGASVEVLAYGVQSFKNDRYSGGGMRYLRFRAWLDEVYTASPFEQVVFEEVRRHAGTDAAHVYGGLLATLTSWCEERKVPYQGRPVGEIKKFWTGKGNANKDAMIAVCKAAGFSPTDDNDADAIAIWHLAMSANKPDAFLT